MRKSYADEGGGLQDFICNAVVVTGGSRMFCV